MNFVPKSLIVNKLTHILCAVLVAGSCVSSLLAQRAGEEITYPNDAFAKLDTFEGLNLQDADKLYVKEDYKGAYSAYKAYSFEFAQSKALSYVLLRMGRCLHQLDKRNAAIKAYQDVIDYFPDDVRFAAAAMYYIGRCHGQNGDEAKQTAVWAKMVKDDDYVAQPNSGTALTHLGTAMEKLKKFDEAAEYHWRTAVNFLKSNPEAAKNARNSVMFHYAIRKPNHEKLAEFYVAASGFDGRGHKTDNPEEDSRYWSAVFNDILRTKELSSEKRQGACKYWVAKMGDRFQDDDSLRKQWCDAQMIYEDSRSSWVSRLEKQFASKPLTMDRLMTWCGYYNVVPEVRSKFFAKHGPSIIDGMNHDGKMSLLSRLHHLRMHDEAQQVMRTVRLNGLDDGQIRKYAEFVAHYEPEEEVLKYFSKMKDKLAASKARFDYYNKRSHRNQPFMEKALAEIPVLQKSPKYAQGLSWEKARLLYGVGRHEEAIKAYRAANKQPDSTWGVTNCLVALKRYSEAIKTVKELEMLGGGVASQAAFKVADIYRISGDKGREVNQLRLILKKYPKSRESSEAHNRLENYGVALTGGEAEAVD